MSIIEEIENLSIEIENDNYFKKLEESLELYYKMIEAGQLKPRENQVQSIYAPVEFDSNYS